MKEVSYEDIENLNLAIHYIKEDIEKMKNDIKEINEALDQLKSSLGQVRSTTILLEQIGSQLK